MIPRLVVLALAASDALEEGAGGLMQGGDGTGHDLCMGPFAFKRYDMNVFGSLGMSVKAVVIVGPPNECKGSHHCRPPPP